MNDSYNIVLKVLEEKMGMVVLDNQNDFTLSDYITDSMKFIQFIVSLEETMGIELPDDFLDNEIMESALGFSEKLSSFLSSNND